MRFFELWTIFFVLLGFAYEFLKAFFKCEAFARLITYFGITLFFVFWLSRTTKIIFYVCLLTHFARQDRQKGNLKNKQNHATKVTKVQKNEVTKMT